MNLYFNLFKVKFTKLDEIIQNTIGGLPRGSAVNVFINLEDVIRKLANPKVDEYLRISGENKHIELISEIINLASHYRLYFAKNKIHSNVYLYIQYPFKGIQKNSMFNKDYRKYYYHKFNNDISYFSLSEALHNAIPLAKIVLEYIEGVYFIESGNIENSVVPKVIMEHTKPTDLHNREINANFIVSTGIYEYQYVNNNTYVIISKQDESEILTKDNVIKYIKRTNNINSNHNITSQFIPFILSIIGNKHRNIYNIKGYGIKKVFKLLDTALNENLITENMNNINLLSSIIKSGYRDIVMNNYYCTDIGFQYKQLNTKDINDITSQIVDRFDNISLKKINDEFFANTPLNLMEITAKVSDIKNKPKVIF